MDRYGTFDGGGEGTSVGSSARCRVRRRSSSSSHSGAQVNAAFIPEYPPNASVDLRPCLVNEASASWLSRLGFLFVEPLVALGGARRLRLQDLWTLEPENTSEQAERRFRAAYTATGDLMAAILRTEWRAIVYSGGLGLRAKSTFSDVTQSLLRAPMSVLYQTPIGEILARYSTDMQVIDGLMSFPLVFLFRSTVSIAAALGIMCYLLGVTGAVFAALTAYMCIGMVDKRLFAQVYSLRAELEAADLNFVSETLDGAAVIRSFGADQVERVCLHHGKMVDDRSRIATVVEVFTHWLYIRCSLLVAVFLFCLALLLAHGGLQASTLGLMLHCIYSIQRDFVSFSVGILNSSVNMFSIANLKKFQHIPPEENIEQKGSSNA
ncbi:hypothetical protein AM588_10011214 [Phytophthora nicotianae]|uniref:ABC transmembrane type-1 domain-containing protein n=1 Tax=Phytophthora nicotianae TaxID=4792 RepID=A0A0W8DS81_PHYNI|nr:hypothetical protein AM588_10011214 [Phytophthora nicotianae]